MPSSTTVTIEVFINSNSAVRTKSMAFDAEVTSSGIYFVYDVNDIENFIKESYDEAEVLYY